MLSVERSCGGDESLLLTDRLHRDRLVAGITSYLNVLLVIGSRGCYNGSVFELQLITFLDRYKCDDVRVTVYCRLYSIYVDGLQGMEHRMHVVIRIRAERGGGRESFVVNALFFYSNVPTVRID